MTDLNTKEIQDKLISVIKNQTNYTEEVSKQKLKEHDNDPISVIREYMGIKPMEKPAPKSLNQLMYSELGDFVDIKKKK